MIMVTTQSIVNAVAVTGFDPKPITYLIVLPGKSY
jgi:hypothetical protein